VAPSAEEPVSIADEAPARGSIPILGRSPADRLPRSFRPKHVAHSSPDDVSLPVPLCFLLARHNTDQHMDGHHVWK
jgi:hypothetical protein